jgi:hypothetical protein
MHLFHGLRFSRQVGGRFIIVWYPPTPHSARFDGPSSYLLENIFDLDKYRSQVSDDLVLYQGPHPHPRSARWPNLEGPEFAKMRPDNFDRNYFSGKNVETFSYRFPSYQFSDENKKRSEILSEVSNLFRSMPHTVAVREALEKARALIGTDKFTVIHVRRSDIADWLQRALLQYDKREIPSERFRFAVDNFATRVAPPEAYFAEIASAIATKRKIVFSADVPNAIDPFERHFGAEHFVDMSTLVEVPYPIQKAFCDFTILTMADKVVSTGSMFAQLATVFGNSKLVNVAMFSPVDELERFAFRLAPELAGEPRVREALSLEIAKSYASRNVAPDGKLAIHLRDEKSRAQKEAKQADLARRLDERAQRQAETGRKQAEAREAQSALVAQLESDRLELEAALRERLRRLESLEGSGSCAQPDAPHERVHAKLEAEQKHIAGIRRKIEQIDSRISRVRSRLSTGAPSP